MRGREDQPAQAGLSYEMEISGLAVGGRGLGRGPQGRVALVENALPGEKVLASVRRVKKDFLEAAAIEVLRPSPQRVEPACAMYGRCGGCDLMHLNTAAQLEAKAGWVVQGLQRLGQVPEPELLASPMPLAYRNRLRLQVARGMMGFFAAGTRELVEIPACPVAAEPAEAIMASLAGRMDGQVKWVELLLNPAGKCFMTLGFSREVQLSKSRRRSYIALGRGAGAAGVRLCFGKRLTSWPFSAQTGTEYYTDDSGVRLWAFPGLFSQINFQANRELVDRVCGLAGPGEGASALDLYAGSGNFALPLAARGWRVTAVESGFGADQALAFSAGQSGLDSRVEAIPTRVEPALAALAGQGRSFELAVLDPPRAGAKGLMPALASLGPRRVIYVSCHPAALARDAAELMAAGYQPSGLLVADMFPQTSQVEAVLVLDRS